MTPPEVGPANELSWLPEESCRPDGLEVLAFHRGKWTHVRWSINPKGWSLGYSEPFIHDCERPFAPLPPKPEPCDGFFDWK